MLNLKALTLSLVFLISQTQTHAAALTDSEAAQVRESLQALVATKSPGTPVKDLAPEVRALPGQRHIALSAAPLQNLQQWEASGLISSDEVAQLTQLLKRTRSGELPASTLTLRQAIWQTSSGLKTAGA